MKKVVILVLFFMILGAVLYFSKFDFLNKNSVYKDENGISYIAMTDTKSFSLFKDGKWQKEFIKGVNMGAAKPGAFPGEFAITKEEYLRWFQYIGKMNANTIRVYTILKPDFYDALLEYNENADKPIYLMQGVWVNEEDISKIGDAYHATIKDTFKSDIKQIIDVIHGNAILPKKQGYASGSYKSDISNYVIGWILGIEWDPEFVETTNANNPDNSDYEGKYLHTEGSSPFEAFLCEVGDFTIDYETETYKIQRPLSFTNWVTTDMLNHPNEPMPEEDQVTVNTEHIKSNDNFKPGLFASYHIYPYYPDAMNYQANYIGYQDKKGKINPYRAYLKDLIKEHTVPVLVAEFGIPASRGAAHVNVHTGFNQGNVDEKAQGTMVASMLNDIYEEGYGGALVFSWQDEWFKRTWNTMDFDLPERRPYWSNPQTNEQEFGLLAFDPGKERSISYVDGDVSEWQTEKPVSTSNDFEIYGKSDEKYIYLMVSLKDFDIEKDTMLIPIDTIGNQGSDGINEYEAKFNSPADFVIVIDGKENARIMVDAYYDSFYYMYGKQLGMLDTNDKLEQKNSGIFNKEYLCLNKELYLPVDKITVPFSKYETGKLTYGNGNPGHSDYNSLSDFIVRDNSIEIRIPWQLLNVMDPSGKMIMDDLYKDGIQPIKIESFGLEGVLIRNDGQYVNSKPGQFIWNEWDMPTYHERLKPSYYVLQEAFKLVDTK